MNALVAYDWPGNVRELENAIERAVILSSDKIEIDSLPQKVKESMNRIAPDGDNREATLDEIERRYILEILRTSNDDKAAAAAILGIDLSTLYRKLKRFE